MIKCGSGHRICKECGRTIFGSAVHHCKPKEKSMENKVIFESDSIFRMTLLQMIPFEFVSIIPEQFIHKCRDKANEYNLIRKSAVEEAEEVYQLWLKNEFDGINLIHKQRNAIQELKAENERLKG